MTFKRRAPRRAERWQQKLREKVTELIGGFPAKKVALNAQTLEVREFPGYRREKFIFTSREGLPRFGLCADAQVRTAPHPSMICLPGHGRGVDDIVGIDDKGRDRTDKAGYQHDFRACSAWSTAWRRWRLSRSAFGCRRDAGRALGGLGTRFVPVRPPAPPCCWARRWSAWRVWDVMRTIDWIETRQELDAKRVGCMGISGGGTVTTFAAALEPRIKAALISGYLNTFRDSILSLSHCIDNYVPGILNWCEMYDVAGLIAPRPLVRGVRRQGRDFPRRGQPGELRAGQEGVRGSSARARWPSRKCFPASTVSGAKRGLPFLAAHL
jgi:hypothetical protein